MKSTFVFAFDTMLAKFALFAALLACSTCQLLLWDAKVSFEVILSLQRLYHARCVLLVAPEGSWLAAGPRIAKTQKLLSDKGVVTSLVGLKDLKRPQRCHANLPLNVIFGSEEETLDYLRGLARVPSSSRWVAFLDADPAASLHGVNVEFDCVFHVVRAHPQGKGVAVMEAYRVHAQAPLVVEHFASFTTERGLGKSGHDLGARRSNFHGIKIRFCVRNEQGITMVTANQIIAPNCKYPPLLSMVRTPGSPIRVSGFLVDVWKLMEAELNFTTEYMESPTGQTSALLANGTWTGCVDAMQRHLADVTAADLIMTIDRTHVLEHIYPTFTTNNRYYTVEPIAVNLSWDNFLAPFSARLWLAVAGSLALLSLALFAAHHCARRLGIEDTEGQGVMDGSQALIYMFGLACGQGHDTTPTAASGRIVYQIGAITGIVVTAAYAAALISFLTVDTKEFPIKSFEDLLSADGRYKFGIRISSGQFTLLETTGDPVLRQVFAKLIKPFLNSLPGTDEEGLMRVCTEPNYGYLTFHEMTNGGKGLPCSIAPSPGIFLPARFAIATKKGYPFRDALNAHMLRLRHAGALRGLRWRYWPKAQPTEKIGFDSVSIEQSTPILAVFVAGACFGIAILMLERSVGVGDHVWRTVLLKVTQIATLNKSARRPLLPMIEYNN